MLVVATFYLLLLLLLQVREDGVVVEQAAGCGGFGKGETAAADIRALACAGGCIAHAQGWGSSLLAFLLTGTDSQHVSLSGRPAVPHVLATYCSNLIA
jgi:hypothetical protein